MASLSGIWSVLNVGQIDVVLNPLIISKQNPISDPIKIESDYLK